MFLRQSTIQTIRFGPFLDATDGVTEEVALTITQALRRLSKDGAAFAQSGTTGNATHDSDGWYSANLSAADTNTVGELILNVQVPATHLPVWMRWWVIEEAVYDAIYGAAAAGPLQSTVAGRTLDVTAAGEAGLDLNNTVGTWAAAQFASNFLTAAKIATNAITAAKIAANAIGASQLATNAIGAAQLAADAVAEIADGVWDEVLTGATHNVVNSAGRRLRQLQEAGGYIGSIWIDTVDGSAGTTNFENGTDTLPSLTLTDANTLAASLSIERFMIAPGSSITLAAAQANQSFNGEGWTLALGGQSIAGSSFRGADISGTGTGQPHEFHDCHLGIVTMGGGEFKSCGLEDTFTISAAVRYGFTNCYHSESGAASTIDFGAAVGGSEVHIHNWHGNLTILNMGAGDILHFTCADGNLTMDASNDGGTRNSAGTFGLTDNSTGMTINDIGQMYQRVGAPVGADISADIAALPTAVQIRDAVLPTQNAAFNNIEFLLVAASDHVTPVTGATGLAVTRSIDGGAFGAGTGTLAEVANGIYQYDASAADMNGGIITFRFVATGGTPGAADDRFLTIITGGGV